MAWEGIHLGRSTSQPGAFHIWLPSLSKLVTSSEVYLEETYMPWRKPGDRQVSDPVPLPADGDAGQPPTLPDIEAPDLSQPQPPSGSLSAEFDRVNRTKAPFITNPSATSAKLSRRVLVLFSGPYARPDGLIAFLRKMGLQVSALDNDASNGGNAAHDILDNAVFESTLRRAQRGEFLAVFAAPPCSTFSISRFYRSNTSSDGGPPVIRRRSNGQVTGIAECPPAHRRELKRANELVARTCSILHAAAESGSEFAMENPADHGDVKQPEYFTDPEHAPIWLMPDVVALSKFASCRYATFPMCSFGVDYEKPTTIMYTPGLAQHLQDLNLLKCEHNHQHSGKAGGVKSHGVWNSAAAAAYPAELNLWIAQAIAHLATAHRDVQPHPLVAKRMGGSDNIIHEADHSPLPSMARVEPSSLYPTSNPTVPMLSLIHI